MKIKVSFTKVVEADSVDDAYAEILDHLDDLIGAEDIKRYQNISTVAHEKTTYKRRDTEFTEMNGFVFENLGGHSGYGEGSIGDWTDTDQ
jgi:hypothetical protein